jgi:hypothetical protein
MKSTKKKVVKKVNRSKLITVNYSSNNSGGSWWLEDADWKALEKAGWKVEWCKDKKAPFRADKNGRWLGALATHASLKCKSPEEAINSWKEITKQDPWVEGCNCCGNPHNFSYTDNHGKYYRAETTVTTSFNGWV